MAALVLSNNNNNNPVEGLRVRTITSFLNLVPNDVQTPEAVDNKIKACAKILYQAKSAMTEAGYEVQTLRIATNPFGEYLLADQENNVEKHIKFLTQALAKYEISFCSVGPARTLQEISTYCTMLVSYGLTCSAKVDAGNVEAATATAKCMLEISRLVETASDNDAPKLVKSGLGNFLFCSASNCCPFIPFFPAGKSSSLQEGAGIMGFAIGLENGGLARKVLKECKSIDQIPIVFSNQMAAALEPLQTISQTVATNSGTKFLGIDTSLNPSLDDGGSVAAAIECLDQVQGPFGGPGSLAATAALTTALQSLPGIKHCGYSGLMLPVCEDRRLAELASSGNLRVADLLSISSVCGVGLDTVPISRDVDSNVLASLLLDVAGLAARWNKSLSCRVLPVPATEEDEMTQFDSPYLCNSKIFSLK